MSQLKLQPIQRDGSISANAGQLPPEAKEVLNTTAAFYKVVGYLPPWICYIATINDQSIGTCGFKGGPNAGCVEIAYFTFPAFEGKGIATRMATALIDLAKNADPAVVVTAMTLPERNASHRILEKLAFECLGSLEHPEDGTVLEWYKSDDVARLPSRSRRSTAEPDV